MSEFYDSPQWLNFGQGHPGGAESTARLLQWSQLQAGDRLLDLCCGLGDSAALAASLGLDTLGIDREPAVARSLARHPDCAFAPWTAGPLPFESASLNGVLCECSLSQLDCQDFILTEIWRVLTPSGRLLLSDLYDGQPPSLPGFQLERWADQTQSLREFAARWLWETGSRFPCSCKESGYFAACYQKAEEDCHGL